MNSPGNDLESVAGQVGAGCNLLFFTTGNGSITNFPFVPTIKVTSTTRRHELLRRRDGRERRRLPRRRADGRTWRAEMFALVQRVASGERTKGELAGHSQVSIWRNWRQTDSRLPGRDPRAGPCPTGGRSRLPRRRPATPGGHFAAFPPPRAAASRPNAWDWFSRPACAPARSPGWRPSA